MKFVKFLVSLLFTVGLVYALNRKWGTIPPMGKFLSPQTGIWKNKDNEADFKDAELHFPNLKGKASVYFDKRLVPHVFAENDGDAYFVQGYLHAKYRLWQMEFQTYYAAGRLSEIVGEKALPLDRKFRRLGMVFAAINSIKETEKDPMSKMAMDNYTAGVNSYIDQLKESELPIEYKLLDYHPEPWSNLKTALLLKYMSFDLSGYEEDFERANTRAVFDKLMYETIYRYGNDSLSAIAPMNTVFTKPGINLKIPANADSLYFSYKKGPASDIKDVSKPDKSNGSNNWAVSGSKTLSGRPILCNDPHLSLNLPSLWYEMQIHTPTFNSYGATLPGTPAVIIGFNDSCAYGFTNAMRDVRDYYEIKFKDASKKEYWFNNQWQASTIKYDTIKIKGKADFIDTVAYVKEFGPVMYDAGFRGLGLVVSPKDSTPVYRTDAKNYAVRWIAHDPSNELKTFLLLNRSKNYNDYEKATSSYVCPGQNMIFASCSGDIAIRQQGVFPAKWYRQGDFPMPGFDSSYMWQGMIPSNENYMIRNPVRGFVSSANQYPYDTKTYPYYLGGNYPFTRGLYINRSLEKMDSITPNDMKELQNDNYNIYAKMMLPVMLKFCSESILTGSEKSYLDILKSWNGRGDPKEKGQTIFYLWNEELETAIWKDELSQLKNYAWPQESSLLDALLRDSAMPFVDNIQTKEKEDLRVVVTNAFKAIAGKLGHLEEAGTIEWSRYKATMVKHLMDAERKLPFSRFNLPIGGGEHMINATKSDHGPSWRMIVQLTDKIEAYGVYPGGQSGNPGSAYYDNFIDTWAVGKYYKLWLMQQSEAKSEEVLFTLNFSK
jgi:penicillin amidase